MSELLQYLIPIATAVAAAYFTSKFHVHRVKADLEKEFESRFNEKKWDIYLEFAEVLNRVLDTVKHDEGGKNSSLPQGQVRKLMALNSKMWLIGSDDVIRAYLAWRRHSRDSDLDHASQSNPLNTVYMLMDVVRAMRVDLGYTNSVVSSRDLAATFVNDIEDYPLSR